MYKCEKKDLGLSEKLIAGGVAGVTFWTAIFPIDKSFCT